MPLRGEWSATSPGGWRHGRVPAPPAGLGREAVEAWRGWFGSWVAARWDLEDVAALRLAARLYDAVVGEGQMRHAAELRLWLDSLGLTAKGQQDRRWLPPTEGDDRSWPAPRGGQYAHLRGGPPRGQYGELRAVRPPSDEGEAGVNGNGGRGT